MPLPPAFSRALAACVPLAALACGGRSHHLDEYSFANRSMATVSVGQPAPGLLTAGYDLRASDDAVEAVLKTGAGVAKDVEARKARTRLDSATTRLDLSGELAKRALERTSRYLGLRPVTSTDDADFLLEIHVRNFGLDARGTSTASLYTNAEAVLLDRRTGREIWNVKVHGTDRLTPRVRGGSGVPGSIIAAGTLHTVSVADFQDALDQLVTLSSNVIADELRASLRDVRRR
jgi:hypothetical protein